MDNNLDISNNNLDISNNNLDISNNNFHVNDITMKYLVNKNHYDKYISKINPDKSKEKEDYIDNLNKYSNEIIDITKEYLHDNDCNIDSFISQSFEHYSKSILKYLKHKEIENLNKFNNDSISYEKDDDIIFSNLDYSYWSNERIKKI